MTNGILDRLKLLYNCKTDLQLADHLGIKQQTLSSWRHRNSCDIPLIISIIPPETDLNWLLKGEEASERVVAAQVEDDEIRTELKKLCRKLDEMERKMERHYKWEEREVYRVSFPEYSINENVVELKGSKKVRS